MDGLQVVVNKNKTNITNTGEICKGNAIRQNWIDLVKKGFKGKSETAAIIEDAEDWNIHLKMFVNAKNDTGKCFIKQKKI